MLLSDWEILIPGIGRSMCVRTAYCYIESQYILLVRMEQHLCLLNWKTFSQSGTRQRAALAANIVACACVWCTWLCGEFHTWVTFQDSTFRSATVAWSEKRKSSTSFHFSDSILRQCLQLHTGYELVRAFVFRFLLSPTIPARYHYDNGNNQITGSIALPKKKE